MVNSRRRKRRGNVVVLMAIMLAVLAGLGAFAIDVGYIEYSRTQLQAGADAAALAAVEQLLGTQATLDAVGQRYASFNSPAAGTLEVTVQRGTWDEASQTFTAEDVPEANAVRVTVVRPDTSLHFGALLGTSYVDISASAVATKAVPYGTRFILDDEMIDTDVPAIQTLAATLGKTPDELLRARGLNLGKQYGASNWTWEDNFVDLPAGATLALPTGQATDYTSNDAGMFDVDHPSFPFADYESFMKFLLWSENNNDPLMWGEHDASISSQMNPLVGASPVTDANAYTSFVNPDFVHVSPVTQSDVSTLAMQEGVPQVNALGLRRGLISFKIMDIGADVDGTGSILPELVIEIVDPATIDPNAIKPPGQDVCYGRLVQ